MADPVQQAIAATNPIAPVDPNAATPDVVGPPLPVPTTPQSPWDFFSGLFSGDKKKKPDNAAAAASATGAPAAGTTTAETGTALTSLDGGNVIQYPPSPISKQNREDKNQPAAEPLSIVFLNGKFKGKRLSLKNDEGSFLGVAIPEASDEQSAEWKDQDSNSIRPGQNFTGISSRNPKYTLTFYDRNHDVSHLVEQLFFMQEISDRKGDLGNANAGKRKEDATGLGNTPPALYIQQGDVTYAPCVCTSINVKYSYPLPSGKGYHHATADVTFKLLGGRGSPNMLGSPLTSTPLAESIQGQTIQELDEQGNAEIARIALGNCLGDEGKKKLDELLGADASGLKNKGKIKALDPITRINLITSGMIPSNIVLDEEVQKVLKEDIAVLMAQGENGGIGFDDRKLAEALQSGKPEGLDPRWRRIYQGMKTDYDIIMDSVKANKLDNSSEIFADTNRSATERFRKIASCGLTLRTSGAGNIAEAAEANEGDVIKTLNETIRKKNDKELKEIFGLESESQVRHLRGGQPYQSRDQAIDYLSQAGNGIAGFSIWGRAAELDTEAKKKKAEEEEEKKKPK